MILFTSSVVREKAVVINLKKMKRIKLSNAFFVAYMCLGFFHLAAQPEAPAGKKWVEMAELTDEFDTWDGVKWKYSTWNYGNTPVNMTKENAGVSDGKLWIKATLSDDETLWMNSSRIVSKTKIFYPMYMECSMKANSISSFNTFWLNNGNSTDRNEIDMCESNANPSMEGKEAMPYTLNSQYFIVKDNVTERNNGNFDSHNLMLDNPLRAVHWDQAYHTIGIWWKDARNVQFYLNGEEAGSVTAKQDFTLSMTVIWDVWTQNERWVGGLPEKDDLLDDTRNTMYVDWIHTYTLAEDFNVSSFAHEDSGHKIDVYPNPASDYVNIRLNTSEINAATLTITNAAGKVVKSQEIEKAENQISIKNLPVGFYVVQVINKGSVTSKVLIK